MLGKMWLSRIASSVVYLDWRLSLLEVGGILLIDRIIFKNIDARLILHDLQNNGYHVTGHPVGDNIYGFTIQKLTADQQLHFPLRINIVDKKIYYEMLPVIKKKNCLGTLLLEKIPAVLSAMNLPFTSIPYPRLKLKDYLADDEESSFSAVIFTCKFSVDLLKYYYTTLTEDLAYEIAKRDKSKQSVWSTLYLFAKKAQGEQLHLPIQSNTRVLR
ncbi:MAG: hypothetical protein ABI597_08100 [Gammaproteobacteria bacterium]